MGNAAGSSSEELSVVLYTFRGGAPPYRGMKLDDVSRRIARPQTVEELINATRALFNITHTNVSYYAAPARAKPPHAFVCQPDFVEIGDDSSMLKSVDAFFPGNTVLVVCLGWAPGICDIGVYVAAHEAAADVAHDTLKASDAPGAEWLRSPSLPSILPSPAEVAAVAHDVTALVRRIPATGVHLHHDDVEIVGLATRTALIAMVDAAWMARDTNGSETARPATPLSPLAKSVLAGSTAHDFKLILTAARARETLGEVAYVAVVAALGTRGGAAPDVFALRRTEASGRWIGFHTDNAGRTVQVALSPDAACQGGRLVFALPNGRLECAARVAGALLAHNGDVVHGVTALTAGVRYSLYALRARGTLPIRGS